MNGRLEGCLQLTQILDEQILAATRLHELLAEEKQAMTGSSIESMQDIDQRKRAQLTHTEQLEQNRRRLCRTLGVGIERGAMDYLINDLAAAGHTSLQSALRTRWQRLGDLIVRCRDANEVNGMIAQFKQRQLLQVLGLLRGGGANNLTYQASGATAYSSSASSRAIAEV